MGRVYPLLILSIVRRPSGRPASCFSPLGCSKTSSKGYSLCSSRWYWASDWSVPPSTAPPCSAKTATALSFVVEFFSRGCGSFPYWRSLVGIGVVPLYRNVNVNQKFRNVWRLFVMCMMKYVRKIGKKNEKVRDHNELVSSVSSRAKLRETQQCNACRLHSKFQYKCDSSIVTGRQRSLRDKTPKKENASPERFYLKNREQLLCA